MTEHPDEQRPAVEFGEDTTDDSGSAAWSVFGPIALVFGAITVALALPGTWDTHVVGSTGRRGAGIVNQMENLGQAPTLAILGGIASVALVVTVMSLIAALKEED